MKYKAIFFDRDGTLTYNNPEKVRWRNEIIESWSERPFELPYEKMMALFIKASQNKKPWYKNVEDEKAFTKRYYYHLLQGENVTEDLGRRSDILFTELWFNNDRLLYPETIEVLEYFKNKGYKMGVISDTSPSLELTLEQLGIAKYFTSFTASSLVGAGKPSPIIFNAALSAQGVNSFESLYVDDYKPEADGAREQGFTSFLINRDSEHNEEWEIDSLKRVVEFVRQL